MSLDFYFDYRSPFSYLANTQIRTMKASTKYLPVDVLAVMKRVSNQPSTACPPKARYAMVDAQRWAEHYGVPFVPNFGLLTAMAKGQVCGDLFSRAGLAAQKQDVFENVHDALFAAVWAGTDDLVTAEGREAFAKAHAPQAPDLWSLAESQGVLDEINAQSDAAAERGVFGVPAMFVGAEMFFGNDRLELARSRLNSLQG